MSHLTPDELVDEVEQTLAPERQQHLRECAACREQAASLATLLREVREIGVPEPSPLFWDSLSRRIRTAIQAQGPTASPLARWFQWPVLVPVGGLTLLVVAMIAAFPQVPTPLPQQTGAPAPVAVPGAAAESDAPWELLTMLIEGLENDADGTATDASLGRADDAVMQLSSLEQQELMRLLREELQRDGG